MSDLPLSIVMQVDCNSVINALLLIAGCEGGLEGYVKGARVG
jgi:hypothetical protein